MKRFLVIFVFTCRVLVAMNPGTDDITHQTELTHSIQKLGGTELCNQIVAQWSSYEKRILATVLAEPKWPSHRVGGPLYFAKKKEVYPDHFLAVVRNKQIRIPLADFNLLVGLHLIPKFESYELQMRLFAHVREHFDTEDEAWDQMDRQLTLGRI